MQKVENIWKMSDKQRQIQLDIFMLFQIPQQTEKLDMIIHTSNYICYCDKSSGIAL
jgi:uncharacterized protein YeaC (DUF1315 family)